MTLFRCGGSDELLGDSGFLVRHGVAPLADVLSNVDGVLLVAHAELALHRDPLIGPFKTKEKKKKGEERRKGGGRCSKRAINRFRKKTAPP